MKTLLTIGVWSLLAGTTLYAVLIHQGGLMFHSPLIALGVGMVGLGMCLEAQARIKAQS